MSQGFIEVDFAMCFVKMIGTESNCWYSSQFM